MQTQIKAQALQNAIQGTTGDDPASAAKRTALQTQLDSLYAQPMQGPSLVQRLHKIVHPKGTVAAGPQAPPTDKIAQMTGVVPPIPKGGIKSGTFDIPGDQVEGLHDVFGNPTDPKKVYRAETDATGRVIGLVPSQPRTSGVPRVLPPISMSSAKRMATQGISFVDEKGEPIDVTQMDDTMQLVPVKMGNTTSYTVTSQGQTHLTVGNLVYAVPKLEQTNLATEGQELGPARVGTTTTRQAIGVDPATGQAVKQQLIGTTAPVTTGIQGRAPAPQGAPQAPRSVLPRVTQPSQPGAQPSPAAAPAQAKPAGGQPAFMTPAMYNQQLQVARPVRVAANQIFGDPTQPEFKPLLAYGDVMNNPASVQRIGAAARLMIQDMADVEATHSGGLWTLITTSGGLPQALASAQSAATRDALSKLQSREQELLNAEMDAYGSIIGFRAITKGSAARFSAQSLEREVPIPGISAFNAFTFYDKLSRLGEEVWSGAKGNAVLSPQEKQYYHEQYSKLLQLKQQSVGGAGGSGKAVITQHSPSTGKYRYSTDGGQTWQTGQPPQQ
jgi:hypothetical protein